jgi:hypothetical protein
MLDMEADELRGNADTFVRAFIQRYRIASGQSKILIYANLDWYRNVLHPDAWADDNATPTAFSPAKSSRSEVKHHQPHAPTPSCAETPSPASPHGSAPPGASSNRSTTSSTRTRTPVC